MRFKPILLLAAVAALLMPVWVSAEEDCDIVGPAAVNEAVTRGFQFNVKKVSGDGFCKKGLQGNLVIYWSNDQSETLICEVTFFDDMQLNKNWKIIDNPKFRGDFKFTEEGKPQKGTNIATFSVRVKTTSAELMRLELESIRLRGPDCDNWKHAFMGD